jgi:peptide methionine sulfoxide reductase msrA/msrB
MVMKAHSILMLFVVMGASMNLSYSSQETEYALFAGGCFWCMEPPFEKQDGVLEVISGYTGGTGTNPTYETYADQGHIEAIKVIYDPQKVSYETLLDIFWHNINPTDAGGQFVDRGPQYRSAIFYNSGEQKALAEYSKQKLADSGRFSQPIATEIIKASEFYPAENYHQDYYKNHSIKYQFYRSRSGRDDFLEKTWNKKLPKKTTDSEYSKPSDETLREILTPLQYKVTQQEGTEPAYTNEYWDNEEPGIYVDIVSGEPLFSSLDKYDSKTGWPSFTKPLEPNNIVEKEDRGWFSTRTEIRSKHGDSHLGHVFNDGPVDKGGLRYCMNSAALRFVPVDQLEQQGYGKYVSLFTK